jgi:hypothetical protein
MFTLRIPRPINIFSLRTTFISTQWLSNKFTDMGIHLHVHSQNFRDILSKYTTKYFHLEDTIPFMDVPTVLSQYDMGLCMPFDGKNERLIYNYTYMLPSKLFDYAQAGIPVLCDYRYQTMSKYLLENNLGMIYTDLDERAIRDTIEIVPSNDYNVKTVIDCEPYRSLMK